MNTIYIYSIYYIFLSLTDCLTVSQQHALYLTIRQRGRVVYEQIVDEGETRVDYLLIDNEAELSNCFKLGYINKI